MAALISVYSGWDISHDLVSHQSKSHCNVFDDIGGDNKYQTTPFFNPLTKVVMGV